MTTMDTPVLVIGDDFALPVELMDMTVAPAVAHPVSPTATVKARVVSWDRRSPLSATVDCLSSASGANWPAGLVVVTFAAAQSAAISRAGPARIEIQVDDGAKASWFVHVSVVRGHID